MDLIESIRRQLGFVDVAKESHERSVIRELRSNLERALDSLSDELYSKATHFLLEFIQNADDNHYPRDLTPTMSISLKPGWLVISCNEKGFMEADVRALCKIGDSTKKNREGYIGEKGIGFKAVFKITDVVYVLSREYSFFFDRNQELGMITPNWTTKYPVRKGWTTFYLRLSTEDSMRHMTAYLSQIQPSLLLFLRKLRRVELSRLDHRSIFRRTVIDRDIVLSSDDEESTSQRYLVVTHKLTAYSQEPKRLGVTHSQIVLAFPLNMQEQPVIEDQAVYAFLPLRTYGFKFIVQGDFLTPSSREDILSDLEWNIVLRSGIPKAFIKAVTEFTGRPSLQFKWLQFIPEGISDGFMKPAQEAIIDELKLEPTILCTDGIYRKPQQVLMEPYADFDEQPLIPVQYLANKFYLSYEYDLQSDKSQFLALGVEEMSSDHLRDALDNMDITFKQAQSDRWHEAVCSHLYDIISTLSYVSYSFKSLRIIPLTDGSWASSYWKDIYFNPSSDDIPLDLGVNFVVRLEKESNRYKLFAKLGLQEVEVQDIAERILDIHSKAEDTITRSSILAHVRYLFVNRQELKAVLATNPKLWVGASNDTIVRSNDVYMDHPRYPEGITLSQFLQAPFVSAEYMAIYSAESKEFKVWCDWLQDQLGVNTTPRLVEGSFAPEFSSILQSVQTVQMLRILQQYWPNIRDKVLHAPTAIHELRTTSVTCRNGGSEKLESTFLQTQRLAHHDDLPFLPVPDPDNPSWQFLEHLGVSMKVDGMYSLKRLIRLSQNENPDISEVERMYEQLEIHLDSGDSSKAIRDAFKNHKLIFCVWILPEERQEWLGLPDVVWRAPLSVQSKYRMERRYARFHRFFISVGVPAECPPSILLDEIKPISAEWKEKTIPVDVYKRVSSILLDLNWVLAFTSERTTTTQPADQGWLYALREEAIFPVMSPTLGRTLMAASGSFYLPDRNGSLAALFSRDAPLIANPMVGNRQDKSLLHITHVLEYPIFKSRLKSLDEVVERKTKANGHFKYDPELSAIYTERVPYIRSLLNALPLGKQPRIVFDRIDVNHVDSVETTFTLNGVTHSIPDELALEMDPQESRRRALRVIIGQTSDTTARDWALASKLGQLLHLGASNVHVALTTPLKHVETAFRNLDITFSAVDDGNYELVNMIADGVREMVLSNSSNTKPKAPDVMETVGSAELQLKAAGIRKTLAHAQKFKLKYKTGRLSVVAGLQAEGAAQYESAVKSDIALPTFAEYPVGDPDMTVEIPPNNKELLNTLGELFMFEVFRNDLPEFSVNHWTSPLRAHLPEYEPFTGATRATFTYPDVRGDLTSRLYGSEIREDWGPNWPTYHIVVKTSEGAMNSSVRMESDEFRTAAEFTIRDPTVVPKDIFVLVRVAEIARNTRDFRLFPDPHRLLYDRQAQIVDSSTAVLFILESGST